MSLRADWLNIKERLLLWRQAAERDGACSDAERNAIFKDARACLRKWATSDDKSFNANHHDLRDLCVVTLADPAREIVNAQEVRRRYANPQMSFSSVAPPLFSPGDQHKMKGFDGEEIEIR